MASVFAFLGMLLLSLVVALLVAFQLADFFGATEEFVLVIMTIALFAVAALGAFVAAYAAARRARTLNLVAWLLALLAVVLASAPSLREWIAARATDPFLAARTQELEITLEILVPALFAVLVQWGLVRRRWLAAAGEEDLTLWPWVTIAVGAFAILNPLGLTIVGVALARSDMLWKLWATVTAVAVAVLVVMAGVECYIRGRRLRRRLAASLRP